MVNDDDQDLAPPLVATTSRHPSDVVRIVAGAVVLAVAVLAVYRDRLSTFEVNLFRLVNDLPEAYGPYLDVVMQAGNALAAPAIGVVALLIGRRRNWRAGFDIAAAGIIAWFAAKVVKDWIQRPRPGGLLDDVARFGSTEGLGFVSGHTAVAAAIACAAAPYLPRSARRAVWAVPWIVGLGRIYFGAHLPLDIIGGAALGWMIGAGLHLLLGAPHGIPSLADAERALRSAGWAPQRLHRLSGAPKGSFPFVADLDHGTVFVKLLDPDTRDRDVVLRLARFFAFREVRDESPVFDPIEQAHREAAMTLLARQHGARVPNVLAIARHPNRRGLVWLVLEHVPSTDLREVDPDHVSHEFLVDLWQQLAALRGASVAHRDLVRSNILVDRAGRPWVVDFAHADSSARPHALANDVAELLASTAVVAGPDRTVTAAVEVLGPGVVAEALPELVPLALTPETRRELRSADRTDGAHETGLLERVRQAAIEATESAQPASANISRPVWWRFGVACAALVGVMTALVVIGGGVAVLDEIVGASPRWLGVATVAWAVAATSATAALVAAIERRIALGRTALVLAAAASAAFCGGRRAATTVTARLLATMGVPASDTRMGTRRTLIATWGAWAVVMAAALIEAMNVGHDLVRPDRIVVLTTIAVAAALVHVALVATAGAMSGSMAAQRPLRGLGGPRWTPIALAAMVQLVAAMFAGVAVVTAFVTPMPTSYAAVLSLAAWAMVHVVPLARAAAIRPAVFAIGVAASGASLAAAAAVGVAIGLVELVGLTVGAVLSRRAR